MNVFKEHFPSDGLGKFEKTVTGLVRTKMLQCLGEKISRTVKSDPDLKERLD